MSYKVFDPKRNQMIQEKIYGEKFLKALYPNQERSFLKDWLIFSLIAYLPVTSYLYGFWQKMPWTKKKILPFIEEFQINTKEFLEPVSSFQNFNDFFIRKLKPASRPIAEGHNLVMPADGRYLVYPDFDLHSLIDVKGRKIDLLSLLRISHLPWKGKTAVCIARLAPVDYHRFHFPIDGEILDLVTIKGPLFSVNPLAIKKNIEFLTENKRTITTILSPLLGVVYMVEIGATHVGSIKQTFGDEKNVTKGMEKGYFEFGGSCVILVFSSDGLLFDEKMVQHSKQKVETLGFMGQLLASKG